jgi:hypothetical protein
MEYVFSNHALLQLQERNITVTQIEEVLTNPQQIIREPDYIIYQALIKFENKHYLVRVFLNDHVDPSRIITVYKTSKIDKYNEGEI